MANDLLEVIGTDEDNDEYNECLNTLTENVRNVSPNVNTTLVVANRKEVKCSKILLDYGIDLTKNSSNNDPVVGRDNEITRVIEILSRRKKNNPTKIIR